MAAFNVTVEDSSPLVNYSPPGSWADSDPSDPSIASYSGRSIRTTRERGAQATVDFNGTGIFIYGSDKPNFGTFTVTVDGQKVDTSSSAATVSAPKKLLASVQDLKNERHTVVVTSEGTNDINIDYMDVQHEDGLPGATVTPSVIDDTDPRIVYEPLGGWRTNTGEAFMNKTLHGSAIAVYGTVSDDHASMRVTLNGQTDTFSAGSGPGAAAALHPQVLLYFADNLGEGTHTISVISDIENSTRPFIDVDAFVVYSFDGGDAGGGTSTETGPDSQSVRTIPKTTIIGAAVGGSVALLSLLLLVAFFVLRRRRKQRPIPSPVTPVLPFQQTDMTESAFNFPPPIIGKSRFSKHSIAPSYYGASLQPSKPNHSRATSGSSGTSSDVIKLGVPKPPSSTRSVSPASAPLTNATSLISNTMGKLMWHDFAHFVSMTASVYAVWSAFYGLFFRKFFWDFVGGTLRDPGGLQPSAGAQVFITLIVKNPIVQIFAMVVGFIMIALEYPLPQLKGTAIHRSFAPKIVGLLFQSFLCFLFYQGTNAGIYGVIAAGAYTRAQLSGEQMEEAKENKGRGGKA
ncbi:hypothetical protein VNI00_011738 [Paramarasmius palmivorus]|uniref:DUF7727 domain-containing protein n=1 Tax=Paramarasmius palmivorus TaxID=297713 RepID=A0AAW0C801_9AGAR